MLYSERQESIEVRKLRFKIEKGIAHYWNGGCPVKTHIFNAVAILTPAFERMALSSVLPYRKCTLEASLRTALEAFIGQEAAHGSEFIRYHYFLRSQGYEIKTLKKKNVQRFKFMVGLFSSRMHLSFTLAAEHIVAIISDLILRDPQWLKDADLQLAAIWRWHAIEEIEHKAVAYDLFQSIKGTYFERILGMLWMTGLMLYFFTKSFIVLVKKDRLLFRSKTWRVFLQLFFAKKGIFRALFFPYFRYFNPTFHPWKIDNFSLIHHWKTAFSMEHDPAKIVEILKIKA